jgi:hypothetical protein
MVYVVSNFNAAHQACGTCKQVKYVLAFALLFYPRLSFWRLERIAIKRLTQVSKNNAQKIPPLKLRVSAKNEKKLKNRKKSSVLTPE